MGSSSFSTIGTSGLALKRYRVTHRADNVNQTTKNTKKGHKLNGAHKNAPVTKIRKRTSIPVNIPNPFHISKAPVPTEIRAKATAMAIHLKNLSLCTGRVGGSNLIWYAF